MLKQQIEQELEQEFQQEGADWSLKGGKFRGYVWHYYKPTGIYGDFFDHTLTKAEVTAAIEQYRAEHPERWGNGDSVDREWVRDTMIKNRDPDTLTEHHDGDEWFRQIYGAGNFYTQKDLNDDERSDVQ